MHLRVHLIFSANTHSTSVWQISSDSNTKSGFNKEIKRGTMVIGAFSNDGSVLRLYLIDSETNCKMIEKYVNWDNLTQLQ